VTITSRRVFPATPYPRNYVHCVFDDLQDVALAIEALQSAGYNTGDIHVMSGQDFSTAIEQRSLQQGSLLQSLTHLFFDYGFDGMYLHEARRGHHIVSVRPVGYEQVARVAAVLARHHARVVKYIDTWTIAQFVP